MGVKTIYAQETNCLDGKKTLSLFRTGNNPRAVVGYRSASVQTRGSDPVLLHHTVLIYYLIHY